MAVVIYIWLIPLALLVLGGLGGLYLRIKQEWPPQKDNRSDLEIALEMEARENAEAACYTTQINPS